MERTRSRIPIRSTLGALGVLLILTTARGAWAEPYYILETEEARTVGKGNLRVEVEVGARKQVDASELYNVPRVRVEYGVAEWVDVEIETEYLVVRDADLPDFRSAPPVFQFNANDEGIGDVRLRLKLVPWDFRYGDLGLHFETKIPTADDRRGLGTDGVDANTQLIYTLPWREWTDAPVLRDVTMHANFGIAVLSQPSRNREQNDYVIWGVAGEYPLTDRLVLMGELDGAASADRTRNLAEGSESGDSIVGRTGLTWAVNEDWTLGATAAKGLTEDALDWEVQVGMSRSWGIGYEREQPRSTSPEMRWTDPGATFTYYNPLWTEEAQVIGPNRFRGEFGFGYLRQADNSNLYRMPNIVTGWGVGEWVDVEIETEYLKVEGTDVIGPNGRVLQRDQDGTEVGDARLHVKLVPWRTRLGDVGALFTTKFPSASDEIGLGTDETDFITRVLLSTNWGAVSSNAIVSRLTTHLNAGVSVQEDPFSRSRQNDVFLWGAAAEYALTDDWTLWAEVHGSLGGNEVDNIAEGDYGDNLYVARVGVTGRVPEWNLLPDFDLFRDWKWSATGSAGLNSASPDYGVQIGVSHTWGLE